MKGNNEFRFNQGTMIDAMQHYLEKIMQPPVPTVTSVKQDSKSTFGDVFIVEVKTEDQQ